MNSLQEEKEPNKKLHKNEVVKELEKRRLAEQKLFLTK